MNKMIQEIIQKVCSIPLEQWENITTGWKNLENGYKTKVNEIDIVLIKDLGSMPPYLQLGELTMSNDLTTNLYVNLQKAESEKRAIDNQDRVKEIYNKIVNAK